MQRKALILLLTLLGIVSCTPEETPGGALRIEFKTVAIQTKTDPAPTPEDGSAISISAGVPDLVILIADSSGDIVATYPSSGRQGVVDGNVEGTATSTSTAVSFSGLTGNATYTVYAFANTTGLWTRDNDAALTSLTTLSAVESLQFAPIAAEKETDGSLTLLNSRIPLSAKGTVTLTSLGNGEISLPLQRCIAKVTAVFENQYGSALTLYDFSNTFNHMLPSAGYVIPHESDYPIAWGSAGNLSASETSISLPQDGSTSKEWYVFPSIGPFSCDVSFYTDSPRTDFHSYSNLPVTDDHARDIPQLARNQHLTITTRTGKGKQVSFNFEVSAWDTRTETVMFN